MAGQRSMATVSPAARARAAAAWSDDAELQPDAACAEADGVVDDGPRLVRRAEDVDHVERPGVRQAGHDRAAMEALAGEARVDGGDVPAVADQEGEHVVGGAIRAGRRRRPWAIRRVPRSRSAIAASVIPSVAMIRFQRGRYDRVRFWAFCAGCGIL